MKTFAQYITLSPDELKAELVAAGLGTTYDRYVEVWPWAYALPKLLEFADAQLAEHGVGRDAAMLVPDSNQPCLMITAPIDTADDPTRRGCAEALVSHYENQQRAAERTRVRELAELARLKAKYEGGSA